MFCTKCGRENKDDTSTCVQCGTTICQQGTTVPKKTPRGSFWKGVLVGIIAMMVIATLIGVIGRLTCETPASVVTKDATEISSNQATLNGEVTDFNDAVDADVSFQWGTSTKSYLNETEPESIEIGGAGAFRCELTGLTPRTTYYYRAKADCGGYGTTYGKEMSFTTP